MSNNLLEGVVVNSPVRPLLTVYYSLELLLLATTPSNKLILIRAADVNNDPSSNVLLFRAPAVNNES
jgi:hypothetical protein